MNNQQKPVCYYHKNCMDGLAAAWCAWKYYKGNIDLYPIQYGEAIITLPSPGRRVYVLDFSFNYDITTYLLDNCDLVMLDHHESSAKVLNGLVKVDQTRSGAVQAWEHFFPDTPVPLALQLVQDRDLWLFNNPLTRPFSMVLFSYPFTVEVFDELMSKDVKELVGQGEALMRKQENDVKRIVKSYRMIDIDGLLLPAVNVNSVFTSDLGEALSKLPGHIGAGVIYHDTADGRIFSLRSRKNALRVNLIAERFGGGGHVEAAGFKIDFKDSRFKNSHLKLRSKCYWWRKLKSLIGFKQK